jgi:hypothetical protein
MREHIGRYFKPFPRWTLWLIAIGLPCVAVGGIGILLIALGMWGIATWIKRPSDAQVDAWIEDDLQLLHGRALTKTGTDPSEIIAEPVIVTGPRLEDIAHAQLAARRGKDNILRFTPINVTVINFTAHQLIIYSCVLDLTTGDALNENTDAYFYGDVVSVATKTRSFNVATKGGTILQIDAAETFQLTTSGGTPVEVVLRAPRIIQMMGHGDIPTTKVDKAIRAVRNMLREKKTAVVP